LSGNPLKALPQTAGHPFSIRAIVAGQRREGRIVVPMQGINVGGALASMGIKLGPMDRVSPLASTNAYNGMTVRVTRVSSPLQKRRVLIPHETLYRPTAAMSPGQRQIVRQGRAGRLEITERVWMLNGKQTRREFVSRRVAVQPIDTVIGLGSRAAYVPSRIPYHNRYARAYALTYRGGGPRDRMRAPVGGTFRALRSVTLVATGYSPDPRENGGYTTTATGLPIGYGAAAVDPRVIPLGTKLYVEGYGYAFACDVGGAIKGRRIDLAYDSYYLANTKGRKKVKVWILGN
jgi:3D (Asp-Asp-Asp) domain-containing protein